MKLEGLILLVMIIFAGAIYLALATGVMLRQETQARDQLVEVPTPTPTVTPIVTPPDQQSTNIMIDYPKPGMTVTSPVTVRGQARVSKNTVYIRIKDQDGKVIASQNAVGKSADYGQFGGFETKVNYSAAPQTKGLIEIYQVLPGDSSQQDLVAVPIYFGYQQ
jgi:hypothetical protein